MGMKGGNTMPEYNQKGPLSKGPMTGSGRGLCAAQPGFGTDVPETVCWGRGMGFGYGYRGGSGSRRFGNKGRGFRAAMPQAPKQAVRVEIDRLQAQAESMRQRLDEINNRIMEIEKNR